MKKFLLFTFLISSYQLYGQVFEKILGTGLYIGATEIFQTRDSCYLLSVTDGTDGFGHTRMTKIDSYGSVLWSRFTNKAFHCIAPLGANHFAAYDYRDSTAWPGNIYTIELSVFDSTGQFESAITIPESLVVANMHPTSDGGTIASHDHLIFKSDSLGNFEWIKTCSLGGITDIIEAKSGGYMVLYNTLLTRLSATGDTLGTISIDTIGEKIYNGAENGFIILGAKYRQNVLYNVILDLDSAGNIRWAKEIPWGSSCILTNFTLSADGNYLFSGPIIASEVKPFVFKMDTTGTILWIRQYPAAGYFNGTGKFFKTHDDGYALIYSDNNQRIQFIKTDSTGLSSCDTAGVSLTLTSSTIQTSLYFPSPTFSVYTYPPYLSQGVIAVTDNGYVISDNCLMLEIENTHRADHEINISPNPATTQFTISSKNFIDENSLVEIFNTLGQQIYSALAAGRGPWTVDCRPFPRGIYFVRLSDSEKQLTQKLVVQ